MTDLLLNPRTFHRADLDPEARRLLRATIEWFESRGKAELTRALTPDGEGFRANGTKYYIGNGRLVDLVTNDGLVDLVTNAGPDADQATDLDLLLALGELFTLVVYGQLILEQVSLTGSQLTDPQLSDPQLSDPTERTDLMDLVDQIFDVLVRDFSAYAVDLHGKASSTKAQQQWALEHVRKPAADPGRYDPVWKQVRDLAGAYQMLP